MVMIVSFTSFILSQEVCTDFTGRHAEFTDSSNNHTYVVTMVSYFVCPD